MIQPIPMRLFYYILLAFLILFDTSCTREINIQQGGPVIEKGQIGGSVVLPANNRVDTTGLRVLSAKNSTTPVNAGYAIDTTGETSTTFLLNKHGDILLMGYNYPGQTKSSVSAESTALAFLMNTLTIRSLSVSGRIDAIEKIKAAPSYNNLVEAVENSLKLGKAISDTTNTELINAIGKVFESTMSGLRTSKTEGHNDPIIIKTANTELQLRNNQVANYYVAGIYKDGVLRKTLTIKGYTFFASGIADALQAIFTDGYGIPESVDYPMSEEGEYEIKIRSGRPGSDDGTTEHKKARNENVTRFIYRQIMDYMPIPASCTDAALLALKNRIVNLLAVKEVVLNSTSSPSDYAFLASGIAADVFADTKEILQQCEGVPEESFQFFKGLGKVVKVLAKAMNVAEAVMKTANIYSHTEDLFKSRSAIDTCFQVVGLKTFKCGEEVTYLVKEEGGNNQKGESGKVLPIPMKVRVTFPDGKPAIKTVVQWVIKSGGGTVSAPTSTTNYDGISEINWTIGSGKQELEAFVNKKKESTSMNFLASTNTVDVAKIEIVSKNVAGGFTNPLKVKVTDADGKPMPNVEIDWKVKSGIVMDNSDPVTNDQGIAEAAFALTLGQAFSMEITVKTDESKFVLFTARPFMFNGIGTIYFHPADDKEILPNPFRVFFVDKYFLPVAGVNIRLTPANNPKADYSASSSDALGLMNIYRDDVSVTQYKLEMFYPGSSKLNESRNNFIIK